jgi:hypothetical protein
MFKLKTFFLFFYLLIFLQHGCGFTNYNSGQNVPNNPPNNPVNDTSIQKGIAYSTWEKDAYSASSSDSSLETLSQTKANWVQIVVTWYQDDISSSIIKEHSSQTASDASIVHAIQKARALGLKVLLKPHLDSLDGEWRANINPTDKNTWFTSYKSFILKYAQIAKDNSVEEFCVGTELLGVSNETEKWQGIISDIRKIYTGLLIYAADKSEFNSINFWSGLDYAGINSYYSLTNKTNPTSAELKAGWNSPLAQIESFQKQINKNIIITEIGYTSQDGTNKEPWDWEINNTVDNTEQEECYKAFFETFWGKSWLAGVYWWYWKTAANVGNTSDVLDFTPQGKPAEKIILQYYSS